MRKTLCLVSVVAALGLGGCFRHDYFVAGAVQQPLPAYQQWHHHFIAGLVTVNDPVQLDAICPQGVAYIDDWIGPLQVILSFVTFLIWTPTTVTIYCRADGAPPVPVQVPFAPPPQVLEDLQRQIPDLEERIAAAIELEREEAAAIAAATGGSGRF